MYEEKEAVLVVDDEESIREAVCRKLESEGYECAGAPDGKQALWEAFMREFSLVLLDIKMPGMSGLEVLSRLAEDQPDTAVVMITSLNDTQTAVEAMGMGAYDYVVKPFDLDALVARVKKALERRHMSQENRDYRLRLEQKVEQQVGQIHQYYREAIEALAREEVAMNTLEQQKKQAEEKTNAEALHLQFARMLAQMAEVHEPYARGHSERVKLLAHDIAIQMGCSNKLIREVQIAAIVHDIGKVSIPDHILFKPGTLTPAEHAEIKRHPTVAVDLIRQMDFFKSVLPIVESHHEWYDGKGYPSRLKGDAIPVGARILSVADAFDAMACARPYRPRLSNEEAIETLKKGAGKQWDPSVVEALTRIMARESRLLQSPQTEI